MQFSTALLALAATFSLVSAQTQKCDAQQYVPTAPFSSHTTNTPHQHPRRLYFRI
jgi:hypothetical protein